jgi:hypothetical protein
MATDMDRTRKTKNEKRHTRRCAARRERRKKMAGSPLSNEMLDRLLDPDDLMCYEIFSDTTCLLCGVAINFGAFCDASDCQHVNAFEEDGNTLPIKDYN